MEKWVASNATLISDAPEEELCHVLSRVKMELTKTECMKSLGHNSINAEMLSNTLAYLMDVQVTDNSITRLLKEGKKDMIVRQVVNMMPLPCLTCNKDSQFKPGQAQVRCRRCDRGACVDCFPEPKNGWAYLCKNCDLDVKQQDRIPDTRLKSKKGLQQQPGSQINTQNSFVTLAEQDDDDDTEEEDELEELARLREEKRKNEEGRSRERGGRRRRGQEGARREEGDM